MKKTMQLDFSNKIAHIEVGAVDGEQVITKTWGKDFGWSEEDAQQVIAMHRHYIANLQAAGVQTSQPIEEKVITGKEGDECLIRSTERFFEQGDMLAALMRSKNKTEFSKNAATQA